MTLDRGIRWGPAAVLILCSRSLIFSDFYLSAVITKALWLGIAAVSLIFLAGYVGMVSTRPGGALRDRGLHDREPRGRRRRLEGRSESMAGDAARTRCGWWRSASFWERSRAGATESTSS